jgi:hypothetical protein
MHFKKVFHDVTTDDYYMLKRTKRKKPRWGLLNFSRYLSALQNADKNGEEKEYDRETKSQPRDN